MPESNEISMIPPSLESQEGGSSVGPSHPTTTDQRGGSRKQKHGKKCTCFLCTFKDLKLAGGGGSDPVCGSCPFPGTGACPFYARGGGCGCGVRVEGQRGGTCGAGLMKQTGGVCGAGRMKQNGGSQVTADSENRSAGRSAKALDPYQRGGGCGCGGSPLFQNGGYKATKRNLKYLKKWRKGESIGFTMTSSLKAKGLIPRNSKTMKGKRVVSRKYKH